MELNYCGDAGASCKQLMSLLVILLLRTQYYLILRERDTHYDRIVAFDVDIHVVQVMYIFNTSTILAHVLLADTVLYSSNVHNGTVRYFNTTGLSCYRKPYYDPPLGQDNPVTFLLPNTQS